MKYFDSNSHFLFQKKWTSVLILPNFAPTIFQMIRSKRILGIDPGTNILGYAVLEVTGKKLRLVNIGVVRMQHLKEQAEKLRMIYEQVSAIIDLHTPSELAIEAPFFGKNVQSMLKLGRAQGVAMAAGLAKGLLIEEYAPKKIKQSVTGNGNATKFQVAAMLGTILNSDFSNETEDATDALGAAVCHHFQTSSVLGGMKKAKGWDGFLKANPDKIWKP